MNLFIFNYNTALDASLLLIFIFQREQLKILKLNMKNFTEKDWCN